jgi:apolipoprotein N-acyltransferase
VTPRTAAATFAPWLAVQSGGVLLGLAFTFSWGAPLVWPALWLILRGLEGRSAWERAGDGSLAGVWWGMIAVGSWLDEAIRFQGGVSAPVSLVVTFAIILVYGGAFVALFTTLYGWLPRPRWLSGPAVWVLLEYLRTQALGGAPWALLGHSQHGWLRLAQLAELGGVTSLSFLIVLVAAAFSGGGRERRAGTVVAVVAVVATLLFGTLRMAAWSEVATDGARVQLVSGGHHSGDRLTTYVTASQLLPPADLTVWPENALGEYLQDDVAAYTVLVATSQRVGPLLVGGPRYEDRGEDRRYYESAFLIGPPRSQHATYDKRRLVPFIERAPLPALEIRAHPFSAGALNQPPLEIEALRAGVLVGWEAVFAGPARDYARAGAHVLVSLTSDEGLGRGAAQQRAFSAFRAIETRRWLLRASGTGVSTAVDPLGRVHRVDEVRVPAAPPPATTYVRHGEVMLPSCGLLLAVQCTLAWVRTKRRTRAPAS